MNTLDKIYNSMDFKTMEKLRGISDLSVYGSLVISWFDIISPSVNFYGLMNIITLISASVAVNFRNEVVLEKSKDVKAILVIYQDVLREYNKLMDIFKFNNPIELYEIFYVSYRLGYLSKDKDFQCSKNVFDGVNALDGTNIISGVGVCRHISAMFSDILNLRNVENCVMPVLMKCIDGSKKNDALQKMFGSHVINMVLANDVTYFLDCANDLICKTTNNSYLIADDYIFEFRKNCYDIKNRKKYNQLKNKIDLSKRDITNDLKIKEDTLKVFMDNIDIFEKFYKENKDKYFEIDEKIKILKNNS